jgi:hypothetical protein
MNHVLPIASLLAFTAMVHAQCPLSFAPQVYYQTMNRPFCVGIGDFNSDGSPDLVLGLAGPIHLNVFLGNPLPNAGTFQAPVPYSAAAIPWAIIVRDFNGDGRQDLVTVNNGGNPAVSSVSFIRGNGDGTFQAPVNYVVAPNSRYLTTGDFNGDGTPDLATSSDYGIVSVLIGNPAPSAGTFQPATTFAVGQTPVEIASGDFNLDGRSDIALAHYSNEGSVTILLSSGDGTFQPGADYAVATYASAIATGDFNGDGRTDLVTSHQSPGAEISILLGGAFQTPITYPTGGGTATSVRVGDFNSDGRPDVVVLSGESISVLLCNANGSFQTPLVFPAGSADAFARAFAAGDVNADGSPDVVVAETENRLASVVLNSTLAQATITQHPARTAVIGGQSAIFSVTATAQNPITYQWRKDGVNLVNGGSFSGASTPTLTINPVTLTDSGASFDCFVSTACGSVLSRPAGLTVENSCPADFNSDGITDFFDYLDFVAAFSTGC